MYYNGYGFGFLGFLYVVIFWIVIIAFIVWIIQQFISKESSKDILEKRYARGDISKKQYLEMKKELRR